MTTLPGPFSPNHGVLHAVIRDTYMRAADAVLNADRLTDLETVPNVWDVVTTAVLDHLEAGHILVPKDETEIRQEWTNSRRDYPDDAARAWTDEEDADRLRRQWNRFGEKVDASKGNPPGRPLRKFTRTTIIHHTPWEATE